MIDTKLFFESMPLLINGAKLSLGIAFGALCLGLLGGTILAIAQRSSIKLIKFLASCYINLVRGTPMLIQIWLMLSIFSYFGLWNLLALSLIHI